jgi:hypothetical protein
MTWKRTSLSLTLHISNLLFMFNVQDDTPAARQWPLSRGHILSDSEAHAYNVSRAATPKRGSAHKIYATKLW